jgi:hypothetical protein
MSEAEETTHKKSGPHPTIDPPAADTAKRARERREALLKRLEEEKRLREKRKEELDSLLRSHNMSMKMMKFSTSMVPKK